jgi:flagellar biosynthesis GTPase FlhF
MFSVPAMKSKTYRAESVYEALRMIRADMGPDAIVLDAKEVSAGGFLGLGTTREYWELRAGLRSVDSRQHATPRLDRGIDLSKLDASTLIGARD